MELVHPAHTFTSSSECGMFRALDKGENHPIGRPNPFLQVAGFGAIFISASYSIDIGANVNFRCPTWHVILPHLSAYITLEVSVRMRVDVANLGLGAALLAVPVSLEVVARESVRSHSAGLSVLLYEPIAFAYPLLAAAFFVTLNARHSLMLTGSPWIGAVKGLVASGVWFGVAFFAVAQLHLSLGGVL